MAGSAENPYSTLVGMIRQTVAGVLPKGWGIGTVISASPLQVHFSSIVLEAGQLSLMKGVELAPDDQVAVIPDAAGALFLVIPLD